MSDELAGRGVDDDKFYLCCEGEADVYYIFQNTSVKGENRFQNNFSINMVVRNLCACLTIYTS